MILPQLSLRYYRSVITGVFKHTIFCNVCVNYKLLLSLSFFKLCYP